MRKKRFSWLLFRYKLLYFASWFVLNFHPINFQADKIIKDVEKRCEQKIEECKEESRQHLLRVQEEHAASVSTQTRLIQSL